MTNRIFFPPDSTELGELSQQLEVDLQKNLVWQLRCQHLRMEYMKANAVLREQVNRTNLCKSQFVLDHIAGRKLSMDTPFSALKSWS